MESSSHGFITDLLHFDERVDGMELKPESFPIFQTAAYAMSSMDEVLEVYAKQEHGYTYSRKRNPNRTVLERAITHMEKGEDTLCFSSAMGGITAILLQELKCGDHVLCNANIYGETAKLLNNVIGKFGVDCTYADFSDLNLVSEAMKDNTRMLITEVLSNPTLSLTDIGGAASIAHARGALLCVDNTFTTPMAIRPYELGADYVVNSLTKFINGHGDVSGGALTGGAEQIKNILANMQCIGTTSASPFDSWLILRGLRTMGLRVERQMENAAKLAHALETNKHVTKVYHPTAEFYGQKELARKMFPDGMYTAMLSFEVPEDMEKVNELIRRLRFARYSPTLGGIRTTLSHPVTSSHSHIPDLERRKIGITPGLIRVSVGIENADDLIADFLHGMEVFD